MKQIPPIAPSLSRVNSKSARKSNVLWEMLAETFCIASLIAIGWFLIGMYARYEFLDTGYPDWIYHAFRVRSILEHGIVSWDHIWSNGINYWRAFHYIEHLLIVGIVRMADISITHAMMWVSISIFIAIRIVTYVMLRSLGINRLFSFFSVVVSYGFAQEWTAIKDFSLYVALFFVPLFVFLWIKTVRDKETKLIYVLAAFAGASWSIHPVIGYSTFFMLILLILANNIKRNRLKFFSVLLVFITSSAPFWVPYFNSGYVVNNPLSGTSIFLRALLVQDGYLGLSFFFMVFIAGSWAISLVRSGESPRWAKMLLFYCSLYLIFVWFGLLGYYPSLVNKLQFSRAIPFIAFVLPFCFAAFFQTAFSGTRSRFVPTVFLILIAVSIVQAIEIASAHSAQPVSSIDDPVTRYFENRDLPKGSIYYKDFVYSSYFGKPGLRFVVSYNRFPNPYPVRFNTLMKTDISFTGVTDHQIRLIHDYSTVLGVEYLFLPKFSPLVNGLTANQDASKIFFDRVDEVIVQSETYAVLHHRGPVANAYVFEERMKNDLLSFTSLPKPTIEATSFLSWDKEVSRLSAEIETRNLKPLAMRFESPDQLILDGDALESFDRPAILITQSYDDNWRVDNVDGTRIEPTSLRFISVDLPDNVSPSEIRLKNSWPRWHWPVQGLGIALILVTSIATFIGKYRSRRSLTESA